MTHFVACPSPAPRRSATLPSGRLPPAQVSVLDKSRSDWREFKAGDEAVEEELEVHKRSAGQVRRRRRRQRWRRRQVPGQQGRPGPVSATSPGPLSALHAPLPPSLCPPQYLDKQAFLKGTELAQYERERDQRLGADVRNRGRL